MKRFGLIVCTVLSTVCMFFSSCSKEETTDSYIKVVNVEYEVGKVKINVGSNVEWNVVSNQEWAKLQQTSGVGNSSVEMSITPGLSIEKRTVDLSFSSVDETVKQTFVLSVPAVKNYFKTPFVEGNAKKDEPFSGDLVIPYSGVESEMKLVLNVIPTGVASGGFNTVSDFEVTIINDGEIRITITETPEQMGSLDFNITGLYGIENLVCSFSVNDLYVLKGFIASNLPLKPYPIKGIEFNPNNYDRGLTDEKLSGFGLDGWHVTCAGIAHQSIIVAKTDTQGAVITPPLSTIVAPSNIIVSFYGYTMNGTADRSIIVNLCNSVNETKSSHTVIIDVGGKTTTTAPKATFNDNMKNFEVEFENAEGTDFVKFEIPKGDPVFFKDFVIQYK